MITKVLGVLVVLAVDLLGGFHGSKDLQYRIVAISLVDSLGFLHRMR